MRNKKSFRSLLGAMVALLGVAPVVQAQTAPANDNFAAAQTLPGQAGRVTGNNNNATKETGEPNHAGGARLFSVWYRWTPTISSTANFTTAGSNFDTILAVYRGSRVNALTEVVSNDDTRTSVTSAVTFASQANTTYYIAVDSFSTTTGNIVLNYDARIPPANDNFANSQLLTGTSGSVTGNNEAATKETGEPNHAGTLGTSSIWYRYRPASAGILTVTTAGSAIDTVLATYLGLSVSTLTGVKSNDEVSESDSTSAVTFPVQAETTYYIAVTSYSPGATAGTTGNIKLNFNLAPSSNPNIARYKVTGSVKTSETVKKDFIISLSGAEPSNSGTTATVNTGNDGTYTLTNILPGKYTLRANKRGFDLAPDTLSATIAKDAAGVTKDSTGNDFTATLIPVPDLPSVSVSDVTIREGNKGDSFLTFNVSLNKASTDIISVSYTTADGTATAGSDYTAMRGNLLFAPGIVTIGVNVKLKTDTAVEGDEKFFLNILGATGASIADDSGLATIVNDDGAVSAASTSARSAKIERRVRLVRLESRHR